MNEQENDFFEGKDFGKKVVAGKAKIPDPSEQIHWSSAKRDGYDTGCSEALGLLPVEVPRNNHEDQK